MKHIAICCYFAFSVIAINSCTTQDFDPPDKIDTVYRIKVENTSNKEIEYEPEVTLHYIDHKESVEVPDSTIAPGDPAQMILESKEGAYSVSIDIQIIPRPATLKIILEEGKGTGDNFEFEKIAATSESNFIVVLRYGEGF